jgi:hypothetical protein
MPMSMTYGVVISTVALSAQQAKTNIDKGCLTSCDNFIFFAMSWSSED